MRISAFAAAVLAMTAMAACEVSHKETPEGDQVQVQPGAVQVTPDTSTVVTPDVKVVPDTSTTSNP